MEKDSDETMIAEFQVINTSCQGCKKLFTWKRMAASRDDLWNDMDMQEKLGRIKCDECRR